MRLASSFMMSKRKPVQSTVPLPRSVLTQKGSSCGAMENCSSKPDHSIGATGNEDFQQPGWSPVSFGHWNLS